MKKSVKLKFNLRFVLVFVGNLVFNIFRGPIELLMGVVFGSLVGFLCWFLPNKAEVLSKTT